VVSVAVLPTFWTILSVTFLDVIHRPFDFQGDPTEKCRS
jgi:hypothetical protein